MSEPGPVQCVFCKRPIDRPAAILDHELTCAAKPVLLALWDRAAAVAHEREMAAASWPTAPLRLFAADETADGEDGPR